MLALAERALRQRDGELVLLHVPGFLAEEMRILGLDSSIPSDGFLDDEA